jgi:uncharacterized protein (DUF2062 family)
MEWFRSRFEKMRLFFFRLLRINEPPEVIARGLALGLFIAFLPLIGFQMSIGILVAILLRQSVTPIIVMVWVTNPATFIPIYMFNYQVGKTITNFKDLPALQLHWPIDWSIMIPMGWRFFSTLWIGSICVGAVMAIVLYFVSIPVISLLKSKRISVHRYLKK